MKKCCNGYSDILDDGVVHDSQTRKQGILLLLIPVCIIIAGVIALSVLVTIYNVSDEASTEEPAAKKPNVIFMISDGFSPASETFARTMVPGQPLLELDTMLVGTSRTYSSMSLITDSAAGASAYACGLKTYNGAIAVNDAIKAQGTAMEAAKRLGYNTGVVTTARVTHATPASFTAHMSHRDYEEEIAEQQAKNQSVNLFFGGGLKQYTGRSDGQNLFDVMQSRGYQTMSTLAEFQGQIKLPVIGLFAQQHMAYEIDRIRENPIAEPSLPQMAQRALELLAAEDEPFFLMIEGGRIDMAAHNHDAQAHFMEIQQYQDTVGQVKRFVAEHPNTYVVSVADHATGGLTLGLRNANGTYPDPYMWYPNMLTAQTASVEIMVEMIMEQGIQSLNATVLEYAKIELTDEEFTFIMTQYAKVPSDGPRLLRDAIGSVISARALVGWTTPGHTGIDVNLYSYGKRPTGFGGVMENIDVGNYLWKELGLIDTMKQITAELVDMTFPAMPKQEHKKKTFYGGHE